MCIEEHECERERNEWKRRTYIHHDQILLRVIPAPINKERQNHERQTKHTIDHPHVSFFVNVEKTTQKPKKRKTEIRNMSEKADSNVAMGRYDIALEMYNTYLESHPDDVNARLKRAHVNLLMKRHEDALNDATRIQKESVEALYVRGVACFWLQEYESALVSFQKALASYDVSRSGKYMEKEMKTFALKCESEIGEDTKVTVESSAVPRSINTNTTKTAETSSLPAKKQVSLKYEYYQTDKKIVVNVLEKLNSEKQVDVTFSEQSCEVTIVRSDNTEGILKWYLHEKINPEKSTWKLKPEKVVLKLKKLEPKEWPDLQGKAPPSTSSTKTNKEVPKIYSGSNKDWSRVDKWCKEELEKENLKVKLRCKSFSKIFTKMQMRIRVVP